MSLSLREQLLKAGLVTEKQAKKAERQTSQQQHQRKKGSLPDPTPEQQAAVRKAQAAKFARDQALNRERQEKAAAKARRAELRQFIDQHRLPRVESDDYYNFVDEQRIRRIAGHSGAARADPARRPADRPLLGPVRPRHGRGRGAHPRARSGGADHAAAGCGAVRARAGRRSVQGLRRARRLDVVSRSAVRLRDVLESLRPADRGWSAAIPEDWAQGRTTFGGLQVALMVRAMRGVLGAQAALPLRSVQTTFVAALPAGSEIELQRRTAAHGSYGQSRALRPVARGFHRLHGSRPVR